MTPPIPAPGSAGICTAPLVKDAETNTCGYPIVVQAQLPMNASGDGPFQASYIAASTSDPSQTDEVLNLLDKLSVASFVLANDISAALRTATPQTTLTATVGGSVTFPLYVKSNSVDTFALSYSGADFNAGIVPAGWRVEFPLAHRRHLRRARRADHERPRRRAADPSDTTTPDATLIACAVVSAPDDASQGTQKVYFKATGTSGVSSTKLDAVTISANRKISLTPNQTLQIAPGGSVTYSHVLANQGNQAEGGTCSARLLRRQLASGQRLDLGRVLRRQQRRRTGSERPRGRIAGANHRFRQVHRQHRRRGRHAAHGQGPAPVRQGLRSVKRGRRRNRQPHVDGYRQERQRRGSACDSPEPAAQSVVDTTNVMTAQIRLLRNRGLDAKCDGVVDLAFSATQIQVKPGECVIYRVQASNQGVDEVTNVIMNDSTPAFSTYVDIKETPVCTPAQATTPANGGTGPVTCNVGELKPGAKATMQFNVKLDD